MKFRLITDSRDALTGMRLAGIEGVFVESPEQAQAEITETAQDKSIGVILVTQSLALKCEEFINSVRLGDSDTLIVTVPGSKSDVSDDNIMRCVHEAIGIKI